MYRSVQLLSIRNTFGLTSQPQRVRQSSKAEAMATTSSALLSLPSAASLQSRNSLTSTGNPLAMRNSFCDSDLLAVVAVVGFLRRVIALFAWLWYVKAYVGDCWHAAGSGVRSLGQIFKAREFCREGPRFSAFSAACQLWMMIACLFPRCVW